MQLEDLLKTPGWQMFADSMRFQMLAREQEARAAARQGGQDGMVQASMSIREADTIRLALAFPATMLDSLRAELQDIINAQIEETENGR